MAVPKRILAVAARTGRLGYLVLDHGRPVLWETCAKAAGDAELSGQALRGWLRAYRPEVFVCENPDTARRKGETQVAILRVFAAIAAELAMETRLVVRANRHKNAYREAEALADQFMELESILPKQPPIWDSEAYQLPVFEALSLIQEAGLLSCSDDGASV